MIEKLFLAGVDVFRINMSHTSHDLLRELHGNIRGVEKKCGRPIGILADLQGPKIRTGRIAAKYNLPTGANVTLVEGAECDGERIISIQYEGLAADVRVGDRILFDDGRIGLSVGAIEGDKVLAVVTQGGEMRSHVGVHLPSKTMRLSALTEKDKEDLLFGLSLGIDYVALSFVRRADDIALVREICTEWGRPTPIIAKIETPDAVENLESVIAASDGAMVARGDLGVEFPPERVPVIQRQILGVARRVRRPVIVATEMLQSMTKNPRPTRAEASDVANAVYAGTDALMLSGETATGDFPMQSVEMMSRIAMEAEASAFFESPPAASRATNIPEAIARGAVNTAREIGAKFLVAFTESGSSALNVSLARPTVPIIAFSPNVQSLRAMNLYWGVIPREMPQITDLDQLVDWATADLMGAGLASPGERVVMVFGAPIGVRGTTNSIRVHVVK
mgnify:CR=1 FL=1